MLDKPSWFEPQVRVTGRNTKGGISVSDKILVVDDDREIADSDRF